MRMEKLSNLLNISIGSTPARKESKYWGAGNKWVSIRDLKSKTIYDTNEEITDIAVKEARCKVVPKGTLLFSFKLTIGKMAFAGCDLFTNEAIAAFAVKNNKQLYSEYLYYALQTAKMAGSNQAAMGKTLNSKSLAEIQIPLPLFDNQIRIAQLLSKVEGLIAQRKLHLQKLDDLLKSVFLEMFGDPVRNEKRWDSSSIEGLCEDIIDCPHSTPTYSDEKTGYFCVRSGDIVCGYLDLNKTHQVDQLVYEERIKRYTPKVGDIVYSREGGRLGNAARIQGEEKICLGQRIMLFIANGENKGDFIWALLESASFKSKLQGLVGGGGAPRVNIKDIKKIVVIKPPTDNQIEFSKIVQKIDQVKCNYQQSLADLENLYGVLSQKIFKGELDLSRVPLPTITGDISVTLPSLEGEASGMEYKEPFALPNPCDLKILDSAEGRNALIEKWLNVYLEQLGSTPFSTQNFMETVQQKLWELVEDEAPSWGAAEYDQLKTWVFQALESGRLVQSYDKDGNLVQIKSVNG